MNKINKILVLFLVIQIVLLAARAFWPESESTASGGALLANFDPDAVTRLQLTDSAGEELVIQKDGDNWVLPDHGNYPVQELTVSLLLDKIDALTTDRLITRSSTSHRRLKVSGDEFERLIEFQAGDTTHRLYLGTSSGGNTIHVRLDDQDQVYLVSDLASQDANPRSSSWIDTVYFSVPSEQIIGLRLQNANGDFEFTKEGDTWTMAGLAADETLDQSKLTTLLNQIVTLRMVEPLGTELQDIYGLETSQATIIVRALVSEETSGQTSESGDPLLPLLTPSGSPEPSATPQMVEKEYTLQIGAALEDGVVIKSSESEYYVLVTTGSGDNFTQKARADFIAVPPTPTPGPTLAPGEATGELPLVSTPEASATPLPTVATPEPASDATEEAVTPEPDAATESRSDD